MPKKAKTEKKVEEKREESKKKISETEYEEKVIELSGKGLTAEKIGETLRKEGIHPKEHEKKISKILKEKGKYINPDLTNVEKKLVKIITHFEKNRQDKRAMREKDRVAAQVRILKKYFKIPGTR